MYRTVFLLLSSILFFCCTDKKNHVTALPYYNEPSFTPVFIEDTKDVKSKITHTIDDFSFLNQDSVLVNQASVEGKIHVANFIFTACGSICPAMTKNMKVISDSLSQNKDLAFLSFSVTPWIDNPYILKKFKESYNIHNPNWHFLTGSKKDIYQLARQSYFAEEDIGFSKDSSEFLHTEHFILVDKQKRIRGIYNGTLLLEMHQLINDIRILEQE